MIRRLPAASVFAILLTGSVVSGGGIQGPLSGYVFDDAAGQIRPIRGLPGGAVVGPPVLVPFLLKSASIAPGGYAITVGVTGGISMVSTMDADEVTVTPIDAVGANPDAVTLNGPGTAAVLYWKDKAAAQIVIGLPEAPAPRAILDLSQIPGQVMAIAVDQTGSYLLVAAADADGHGGIYRVTTDGSTTTVSFLVPAIQPTAIRFLHGGRDAVVADAGANQILLITDISANPAESILATSSDGIDSIDRLAVSDDQDYVLAASSQSTKLIVIHLSNGFVSAVENADLPCVPSRLSQLSLPHLYVLSGPTPGPVELLDTSRGTSTYFVPPVMTPAAAQ
jgi:hypothetical protein